MIGIVIVRMIGFFFDNIEIIDKKVNYLIKYNEYFKV